MFADRTPQIGDLLARARQSWVTMMSRRLAQQGYVDYRRGDPVFLRRLKLGSCSVGELADVVGVSRQATRKQLEGLEERGFVVVEKDADDSRRLNASLTSAGAEYARVIVANLETLNDELIQSIDAGQLNAAKAVLSAVIAQGFSELGVGARLWTC